MLHNIIYMNMVGNGRGVGITEMLHGQVEVLIVALFAVITQLGDVWFLFLLGSILYVAGDAIPRWGIDRRRGLFVLGLVITYIALIGLLKNIFVLPRPPGAGEPPVVQWLPSVLEVLFNDTTTAAGPGFPSGHALGSTMTWGGLALVLDRGTYRTRISVAGAVVVLVSVSRLVLGVHYFVDVLVGVVLGVVVLGLLYWLTDHGTDPGRILLVAVVTGIMGIFVGITFDSVAAIGGAVGGGSCGVGLPTRRQHTRRTAERWSPDASCSGSWAGSPVLSTRSNHRTCSRSSPPQLSSEALLEHRCWVNEWPEQVQQ